MKTALLLIISVLGISLPSQALVFQEIKGHSVAEKQIQWIWKNRKMLIKSCQFDSAVCTKNPKVSAVVGRIAKVVLETEKTEIKFLSEKENPGFFTSNQGETHRVAMTSLVPTEPIYFNTDLISTLNLTQMTGILFHELTHKLGILDDADRWPDQVGAVFAAHLQQGLQISAYPLRNGKKIELASFRTSLKPNLTGDDFDLGPIRGFGYLADANIWIDLDFSQFELSPACSETGMQLAGQYLRPPIWRPVRNNQNKYRGIILLNNMCVNVRTAKFEMVPRSFFAEVFVNSDGTLSRDMNLNLGEDLEALVDYYSTVELISAQVPHEPVKAGAELKVILKVRNKGEMKAVTCQGGFIKASTDQVSADGVMEAFSSCKLKSLGNFEYEVEMSTALSPSILSGTYRFTTLKLEGADSKDVAFLRLDSEVTWKIDGLAASSIQVQKPQFVGLKAIDGVGKYPFKDSYMYSRGQRFTVDLEINTKEQLKFVALGLKFQIAINGQLASSPARGAPEDFKGIVQTHRFVPKGNGQVLQIEFLLPDRYLGKNQLFGFRLDEVLLQNRQSGEIGLFRNTEDYQYLVMLDKLIEINQ